MLTRVSALLAFFQGVSSGGPGGANTQEEEGGHRGGRVISFCISPLFDLMMYNNTYALHVNT